MKQNKWFILIYLLIGLAAVGFISQLFGNTAKFLVNTLLAIGFSVIVFGVIYFLLQRQRGDSSNEMKKYKLAVKQSKKKYQQDFKTNDNKQRNVNNRKVKKQKLKRRVSHLRVIEGSKHKETDKEKKHANL